jgi:hypothetical protein
MVLHGHPHPCWVFFCPYFHSTSAYECLLCTVCRLVSSCFFIAFYWLLAVVILQHYIQVMVFKCFVVAESFYMCKRTVSVMSVLWCFLCMFSKGECKFYRYSSVNMAMENLVLCLPWTDVYQLWFSYHGGFQKVALWLESVYYFLNYAVKFPGMLSCQWCLIAQWVIYLACIWEVFCVLAMAKAHSWFSWITVSEHQHPDSLKQFGTTSFP